MSSICILTDSAAQFPQLGFSGKDEIRVIPYDVAFDGKVYEEGKELKPSDLPPVLKTGLAPRLIAPSAAVFEQLLLNLGQHYRHIITILTSAALSPAYANASQAVEVTRGRVNVTLIDSQITAVGLGLLVQAAAEASAQGMNAADIERLIRKLIPRTYMMLCTPGMSYLHNAGFVDHAQAFVGEMLGLLPIFTLEEGRLSALEKVRNARALVDLLSEFICEFDDLQHISLIQSCPAMTHEARLLREQAQNDYPQTPFSELNISLPLATLIGPRSLGLVVIEKV
jgi:DegV family protein with EDD domain